MAKVGVKLKVLPSTTEVDLDKLKITCSKEIESFGGKVHKVEKQPIAFGLVALEFMFTMEESKGSLDPLEDKIKTFEGVRSAEVIDVRRLFG